MKRKKSSEGKSHTPDDFPISKKEKLFSGLVFRQKISGEDSISVLKWFLQIFREQTEQDIVLEFFEAGGNGEEILLLLGEDTKNTEEISIVFNVLECIFMRIMTDLTSYLPDAEETAKCLLQSHLPAVYSMLAANSSDAKTAVLKLLTVMSTLSTKVAKYILTYLKISFNMLCGLARHDKQNSVRTHFVHFVLSFIVEGNPHVIKLLLDKKGFLKSIIPGLMYDTVDTVELVLATLVKHVLENPLITKTTKLHTFNSTILKSFFELFNWKGPQKQGKKKHSSETLVNEVNPISKNYVEEALYSFLRVLCASQKFGVVFFDHSLGTSGRNHNQLVHKVLETLEKPWEHNFVAKLLVEIFVTCPDLIHSTTSRMAPFLEPRLSPKWFKAMDFIEKVINTADPSTYLSKPGSLTQAQLLLGIEHILTPKSILQVIVGSAVGDNYNTVDGIALMHSELLVRHTAVCFLNSITKAILRFLDYKGLEDYFCSLSAANQFRQNLLDHLCMALPSVVYVIQAWKQALYDIKDEEGNNMDLKSKSSVCDIQYPSAADHLKAVLSLLLAYAKWWPPLEVATEGDAVEDGWGLLSNQDFLMEAQQFEGLEAMALELLSVTGGFTLSADQGLSNQDTLRRLLHLYGKENDKSCYQSWRKLILAVLLKTGLFDGNETEACIWIHCYRFWCSNESIRDEKCDFLAEFIISSLHELISSSEHYVCIISNAFEMANIEEIPEGGLKLKSITSRLLTDMMEKDIDARESAFLFNDQTTRLQTSTATISPLLPAALVETKKYPVGTVGHAAINHYLLYVVLHILHGQDTPKPLTYLLESSCSSYSPPKSLQRYLKSWSTPNLQCMGELLSCDSPLCHLSSMLLAKTKVQNAISNSCFSHINGITDGLDVLLIFRLVIFHLIHLAQQNNLKKDILVLGKDMLIQLIQHPCLSEKGDNLLFQKAEGKYRNISGLCLQSALNNSIILKFFEPLGGTNDSQRHMTHLIDHILDLTTIMPDDQEYVNDLSLPFKNKLLQSIYNSLAGISRHKEESKKWDKEILESSLSHFMLTSENVISLLKMFGAIPSESLVDSSNWNLSGPGLLLSKLLHQLCKLKKMGFQVVLKSDDFEAVADHLCYLEEKFEFCTLDEVGDGLSHLEDRIFQFLEIFPHLIEILPQRLLQLLIFSKLNRKSANKLGQLLINQNETFRSFFLEQCTSHWNEVSSQPDRVLSYLTCILEGGKYSISEVILMKLYKEYKGAIKEAFSNFNEVPLWLENNVQLFKLIVKTVIDEGECYNLCNLVKRKFGTSVKIKSSLLEVAHSVFEKADKSTSIHYNESPIVSFLRLLLHGFVMLLKNTLSNQSDHSIGKEVRPLETDVIFYSTLICAVLERMGRKEEKLNEDDEIVRNDLKILQKEQIWKDFTQLALKVGLSQNNSLALKCLEKLCSKVLTKGDSEAVLLYKMSVLHSKFLDVMLEDKIGKGELLELLLTLTEKNPANLSTSLIPVLLSSYNATLGKCDLLILKLLQMLDCDDLNFNQFSPYLWGEMAASFYSLRTKVKFATFSAFSVLRQPKADQVLDLIELGQVERTISNFPIHRGLHAEVSLDINSIDSNVYDPCFYLPLLSHILAPENPVKTYKFAQSGALALTVAALGSSENQVRAAAMHVVARFYSHLETGRPSKEKKLWMHFVNSLRNGFGLLAKSRDVDVSCLRLPPVVAIFLAKASLVMTQPQHIMFYPLHNYFLAKPALDLDVVPEFFRLFNSFEVDFRYYRHWILEVLRDGLKDASDFHACLNSGTFKLLMSCFCSVVCDEKSKVLILEIFASAAKTPSTAYYLVKGHGLISWLLEVVHQLPVCSNKEEPHIARSVIHLFSSLWFAFFKEDKIGLSSESDTQHSSFALFISENILHMYLSLLPKIMFLDLQLTAFFEYMKSLWSVTQVYYKSHHRKVKLINRKDVNNAIQLGKNVLKQVDICQDVLEYGCYIFPPSKQCFNVTSNEALQYLFNFVVNWCQKG